MFSKDLLFTKIIGALKFLIFISFSLATKLKIFYYIFFQRITQRYILGACDVHLPSFAGLP